jgi:hypothetical protein
MIGVCVCKQEAIHVRRVERERLPIQRSKSFIPLEETTVDEVLGAISLEQSTGASNRSRCAKERKGGHFSPLAIPSLAD